MGFGFESRVGEGKRHRCLFSVLVSLSLSKQGNSNSDASRQISGTIGANLRRGTRRIAGGDLVDSRAAASMHTAYRRGPCTWRISHGSTAGAAATPFLSGSGGRGWCATIDWFMANDNRNVRKVLDGRYEPSGSRRVIAEVQTGAAPVAAMFGARVSAAALERIRARDGTSSQAPPGTTEMGDAAQAASPKRTGDEPAQTTSRKGVA